MPNANDSTSPTSVVIPMAGFGSRFESAGYSLPKPLLPYKGVPLYAAAAACLPLSDASSIVFVVAPGPYLSEIRADILQRFGTLKCHVVITDGPTRGQAESVLFARDHVQPESAVVIHNVDTLFHSTFSFLSQAGWDGVAGVVRGVPGSQWSFVSTNEDGHVDDVVEKRRVSDFVCTGLYCFRTWRLYESLVESRLDEVVSTVGEAFVAPLLGAMAAEGMTVRMDEASWMLPLGTPDEYEHPVIFSSR